MERERQPYGFLSHYLSLQRGRCSVLEGEFLFGEPFVFSHKRGDAAMGAVAENYWIFGAMFIIIGIYDW